MEDLLSEMKRCRTVKKCIDVATTDAYGDEEQATSWLTCAKEMFGKFDRVKILGQGVKLEKLDLDHCGLQKRNSQNKGHIGFHRVPQTDG